MRPTRRALYLLCGYLLVAVVEKDGVNRPEPTLQLNIGAGIDGRLQHLRAVVALAREIVALDRAEARFAVQPVCKPADLLQVAQREIG